MFWNVETKPDEAYFVQESIVKLRFQYLRSMSPGAGHARGVSAHTVSYIENHIGRQRRRAHRNPLLVRWPDDSVNRFLGRILPRISGDWTTVARALTQGDVLITVRNGSKVIRIRVRI